VAGLTIATTRHRVGREDAVDAVVVVVVVVVVDVEGGGVEVGGAAKVGQAVEVEMPTGRVGTPQCAYQRASRMC